MTNEPLTILGVWVLMVGLITMAAVFYYCLKGE